MRRETRNRALHGTSIDATEAEVNRDYRLVEQRSTNNCETTGTVSFDGAQAPTGMSKGYSCTERPRPWVCGKGYRGVDRQARARCRRRGIYSCGKRCEKSAAECRRSRRNTEGSVGEKLAKGWNEVPSGNVAFVDGEAVDGTTVSCVVPPPLLFFKKSRFVPSPLRKLAEVKVPGLPCRSLIRRSTTD